MRDKQLNIEALWFEYKKSGSPELQERLIEYYLPFVKSLAIKVMNGIHAHVELDDFVSDGVFGLLRAIEGFEPERGFKFETYATPVIRGAIFNGMRRMDWLPERMRSKTRALQKAIYSFSSVSGRRPTEKELAEELNVSASEVFDLISCLGCVYMLSLDQPLNNSEDNETSIADMIGTDADYTSPDRELEFSEERQRIRSAINCLNEREQLLIKMHYFEGVTFEKISRILGVSKQRVSQIHSRAVKHLRDCLGEEVIEPEVMSGFLVEG